MSIRRTTPARTTAASPTGLVRLVVAAAALVALLVGPIGGAAGAQTGSGGDTEIGAGLDPEQVDFATVAALDELTGDHARVFRLYEAAFDRQPDAAGSLYWVREHQRCLTLEAIAELFVASPEFAARYGQPGNRDFVETVYRNVLDRGGDQAGLDYWTGLLAGDRLSRGGVLLNVSLSAEFTGRHPYPSDGVPGRPCRPAGGSATARSVTRIAQPAVTPLVTVAGLTLRTPAAEIELAGFHQSTHPGALPQAAVPSTPVPTTVMDSRGRGTSRTGAVDIAVDPDTAITAPIAGRVARAGEYTLYCRYRDGFVVINPDGRPDLEVKVLHVQGVAVRAGQRVEVGDRIAATATLFPFESQIDELTAEPSWPHVHIEVVDPSTPRRRSSGSC